MLKLFSVRMLIIRSGRWNTNLAKEINHGQLKQHWNGPLAETCQKKESSNISVSCNLSVASDPLANQMKKWWGMVTYASVCDVSGRSKEEKRALPILERTTKHNGERYEVGLMWADDNPDLPNNFYSAYQQFLSMDKSLEKDLELTEAYKATIEKDFKNHFIRKLDQEEVSSTENDMQWYLPHHPVKHPHKPGKVKGFVMRLQSLETFC